MTSQNHSPSWQPDPQIGWSIEILNVDDILIHERHDPSRSEKLLEAIRQDGVQRHPVIVVRRPGGGFIHVDGANRLTCMKRLGIRHIVAQVIEDTAKLGVDTWAHLPGPGMNSGGLETAARSWTAAAIDFVPPEEARDGVASGAYPAAVWFRGCNEKAARIACNPDPVSRNEAIHRLTECYHGTAPRTVYALADLTTTPVDVLRTHSNAQALVAFAVIALGDLLELVAGGGRVAPAGVTRFILKAGRVLDVNAPLDLLAGTGTAAEKTIALLRTLYVPPVFTPGPTVRYEPHSQSTRLYEEPIYSFVHPA